MGKVVIVDAITGEVTERLQTVAEKTQSDKDKAEAQAQAEALEAKAAARQAVLDRLGLTEQEAQLLLGS